MLNNLSGYSAVAIAGGVASSELRLWAPSEKFPMETDGELVGLPIGQGPHDVDRLEGDLARVGLRIGRDYAVVVAWSGVIGPQPEWLEAVWGPARPVPEAVLSELSPGLREAYTAPFIVGYRLRTTEGPSSETGPISGL